MSYYTRNQQQPDPAAVVGNQPQQSHKKPQPSFSAMRQGFQQTGQPPLPILQAMCSSMRGILAPLAANVSSYETQRSQLEENLKHEGDAMNLLYKTRTEMLLDQVSKKELKARGKLSNALEMYSNCVDDVAATIGRKISEK